jgi:hypothetical protein
MSIGFRNPVRTVAVLTLGVCAAQALFSSALAAPEEDDLDNRGVFFRLGGGIRAGVRADIRNTVPVTERGAGAFDDGYVKKDTSGSDETTWNWGFDRQAQLGENRLSLHKTDNAPRLGDLKGLNDSPLFGGEIFGGVEMARPRLWKRDVRFGFEVGYGFNTFSVKGTSTETSMSTYTTAVYDTTGVVPPSTPSYHGTFDGPGSVIGLEPLSTTSVEALGTATLDAGLDADLHTLKVGPWMQVPLTKHFLVGFSLGVSSIYASSDLTFTETYSYAEGIPSPAPTTIRLTRNDWRVGAYTQARLEYEFNRHWGAYVGADLQYNPNMKFGGSGREATLKFEGTYGATAGVSFRF